MISVINEDLIIYQRLSPRNQTTELWPTQKRRYGFLCACDSLQYYELVGASHSSTRLDASDFEKKSSLEALSLAELSTMSEML